MPKLVSTCRVAVVKATGDMYVVQQISINHADPMQSRVHCMGEIVAYKTGRAHTREEARAMQASFTYSGSKAFVRDAVDIVEMAHDGHLGDKLLAQANRNKGGVVRSSFRRAR